MYQIKTIQILDYVSTIYGLNFKYEPKESLYIVSNINAMSSGKCFKYKAHVNLNNT